MKANPAPDKRVVKYRSNHWVKTPFLLVPKQYAETADKSLWKKHVGIYVCYEELYKDSAYAANSEEILLGEIRDFDFNGLLQYLAILNYFLSDGYGIQYYQGERHFIEEVFSGLVKQRLINFWSQGRKLVFRQQILALMQANLIHNDEQTRKLLVGDNLDAYCRIFYRIIDFLEIDRDKKLQALGPKGDDTQVLRASMARNYIFNSHQQFRYLMPRYWTIYFESIHQAENAYPRESFPLFREFINSTGFSLELYIFLVFGIVAHYQSLKLSDVIKKPELFLLGGGYFRSLKEEIRDKAKEVFQSIAYTKDEFKSAFLRREDKHGRSYYNFQPIWRRPLYKIHSDAYYLLDMQYLQERISFGIYGEINDYLLNKEVLETDKHKKIELKNRRTCLAQFTGRCFEVYVSNLLRRMYPTSKILSNQLFSELEKHYTDAADFIILYPDSIMIIEATVSSLNLETVLRLDMEQINKEIQGKILFKEERKSRGKVYQLDATINKILHGDISISGFDWKRCKKFYPILLLQKGLPHIPFKGIEYKKWIQEKGLLDKCLDNFLIMDIEDLEMIEPLVESGASFIDIICDYFKSPYRSHPLKHYLIYSKNANEMPNRFLEQQLTKMTDAMKKYFAG